MLFLADSQHANFNQHRQISAGQIGKGQKLSSPNCPALCNFSTWDWQKMGKPRKWRSREKFLWLLIAFPTVVREFLWGKAGQKGCWLWPLFYLPGRQLFGLSVCVCVLACLYRMIESWPTATFSINFNARQPADLKKIRRTNQVWYLAVSPPVCPLWFGKWTWFLSFSSCISTLPFSFSGFVSVLVYIDFQRLPLGLTWLVQVVFIIYTLYWR